MAGVFKSLDKSDIRVVPFRAHKQWVNDLSYTLTPTPTASVTLGSNSLLYLQTNFSQSINVKNNYYYYRGKEANLYLVDGNDDYALLAQTTNSPNLRPTYLGSAGPNQNYIMYYNTAVPAMCAHLASDLSDVDVDTFSVPTIDPRHITWLPGGNIILLSAAETPPAFGLTSVFWNEGIAKFASHSFMNTNTDTNYLGTTFAVRSGSSSNFFAAYTDTANLDEVYFEYKNQSGSLIGNPTSVSSLSYTPTAIKDFVSNGSLTSLSAFATVKDGIGLWLISGSNTLQYTKYEYDVVRLLQDKDLYRNNSYNTARTFAVLRDGTILLDLYADNRGYGWGDSIDARRWVGSGQIIAATINKNVDLLSATEPLTITVYSVANPGGKGPITVFTINLVTQEISDPIHLGYHSTEGSSPFFGDDGTVGINFIGDNSINKVVGLMLQTETVDIANGNAYSQIYTFNT
jgi:hypothetical protein